MANFSIKNIGGMSESWAVPSAFLNNIFYFDVKKKSLKNDVGQGYTEYKPKKQGIFCTTSVGHLEN